MGLFDYWGVLGTGIQSFFAWAAFNQSAFADNVAMRQNQKYQQQNYQISWIAIARDDIRDMMGISVNRINNYMIVATLILSIAAGTIVSVKFSPNVPDFIVFAFYTCIGISLVFLTLAIMFGVKGQNCAFTNTMKLLTYQVRPESPADYTHDYMRQLQWLERRGMSQLLRIPGVQPEYEHDRWGPDGPVPDPNAAGGKADARQRGMPAPKTVGKPQESGQAAAEVGCFGGLSGTAAKPSGGKKEMPEIQNLEDATPLETLMKRSTHTWYLTKFARFMGLWMPYDSYSKHAMGLGIIALGQGSAYWALGTLISEGRFIDEWAALLLAFAFVYSVTVILFQNFTMHDETINLYGAALVFVSGPMLAGVAATTDNKIVVQIFAPLSMLAHATFWGGAALQSKHTVYDKKLDLLNETSNLWKTQVGREEVRSEGLPVRRVHGQVVGGNKARRWNREGDRLEQHGGVVAKGSSGHVVGYPTSQHATGNDAEAGFTSRSDMWPTDHDEFDVRQSGTVEKIKRTMQLTLFLSAFLWFGVFLWATAKYWWAPLAEETPPDLSLSDTSYAWPSPLFRPHALACSDGKVFAADRFKVWELTGGSASPVRCDLSWPIIDISAFCEESSSSSTCRVFALVQPEPPQGGSVPAEVIECGVGTPYPLLQGPAHQIAVSRQGSGLMLLVEHEGDLSEYAWSSDEGWLPQYYIGHISSKPVRSLGAAGSRLLVFYAVPLGEAAVESLDIGSASMREEWGLPESKRLLAGCAPRDGQALLLFGSWESASRSSQPELLRTKL